MRFGYDGIELRLLDGEVIVAGADGARLRRAVTVCRDAGIDVCALDTSCRFNLVDPAERARQLHELLLWIGLARDLQVSVLRVFGGESPASEVDRAPQDEENAWVAESLARAAPEAEAAGVTIALETHDAFSSARRVAEVLRRVPSPRVAALWDILHPFRIGESAEEVLDLLGPRIAHVHVKDARRPVGERVDWALTLPGEGDVPIADHLRVLEMSGYSGYVSVEWEKKWHPDLPDPEIALSRHTAWMGR